MSHQLPRGCWELSQHIKKQQVAAHACPEESYPVLVTARSLSCSPRALQTCSLMPGTGGHGETLEGGQFKDEKAGPAKTGHTFPLSCTHRGIIPVMCQCFIATEVGVHYKGSRRCTFLLCLCDSSNFLLLHSVTVFKKENNGCILRGSELQKALGSFCKRIIISMVQLMFKKRMNVQLTLASERLGTA